DDGAVARDRAVDVGGAVVRVGEGAEGGQVVDDGLHLDVLRERSGGGRTVGVGGVERGPSSGVAPGGYGGDGLGGVRGRGGGRGVGGGGGGGGGGRPSVQRDERAGDGGERGGHLVCGDGELHAFGMGAGAEPSRGVEGTRDEVSGGAAVVRGVDQLWRSV